MPGTDQKGISGFTDKIDNHYLQIFGTTLAMSAIIGGLSYGTQSKEEAAKLKLSEALSLSLAQQIGQTSLKILEKNLDIAPTIEIRQGYRFNIMVTKDITFIKPYHS